MRLRRGNLIDSAAKAGHRRPRKAKGATARPARLTSPVSKNRRSALKTIPRAVVGIGASAGGLDPCRRFFTEMPADSGLAFLVIQHLAPDHKSEMALLLGRCTQMPVTEAVDRVRVEPNHVYVIPPNRALAILNGRLRLTQPKEKRGSRMAIDFCFRSLAADCRERAIGIVLSGTLSDGTLGLAAIKEAGGLTIAQEPSTADQEGMPQSAIAHGVDFVLPVEKIPRQLLKYVKHPYLHHRADAKAAPDQSGTHIQSILSLLRARGKFDFGNYKHGTLERRVQRRMNLRHIIRFSDYLELLRRDGNEIDALLKDLLICVTHFFREPEAWKVLQEQAVRSMVAAKSNDEAIRVWVPGCATGEEAYSLGMVILDELHAAGKRCTVNIFASDVNREAFSIARLGMYGEHIAAQVSVQRLQRYFVHEKVHYRVRNNLRDAVVFAEHNLLSDPPFSRLDLISCRNLMIYLDPDAQKKLIALFHYALRDGGVLFLGSAETVGDREDLFRTISRKFRIYGRVGAEQSNALQFRLNSGRVRPQTPVPEQPSRAAARFTELAQQIILDRCAPASVVINQKDEILYTCGRIEDYLKRPAGIMHTMLLSWLTESMRSKLRGALRKARTTERVVTLAGVRMHSGRGQMLADITVERLNGPRPLAGFSLITFHRVQAAAASKAAVPGGNIPVEDESLARQLEDELTATREDLHTNIDELATSNEDLRASNEEVTSGNEELQSTNEELETSKEELQSLNEELSTVNGELQEKVDELETKTNDLNNLLTSTDIATIFLDRKFHIKWFSGSSTRLLNLREADIGRPIGDLAIKFIGVELLRDAKQVLQKLAPVEREIIGQQGHWNLRRMLPYRTTDNHIEGLVVTFVDIHGSKLAEEKLRRMAAVLRDCNDAVTVQDFDGRILAWNHGAEVMYGYTEKEALRRNGLVMIPASKRTEMRSIFRQLKRNQKILPLEVQRRTKAGKVLDVWLTISALLDDEGHPTAIATTERDITQRKQDETALRDLNQWLEKRVAERSAVAEQQALRLRELAAKLLVTEEQERRSLAEDLHDNLSQVLHVAKLKLSELRSETKNIAQSELFVEIDKLLVRANQSARSLSYQLSPPVLHELGLVPALEWLGEEMGRLFRIDVKVSHSRHAIVTDERTRIVLFRSARELLVSVAKHLGVRRAALRIHRNKTGIVVTVEDRGVGFDPKVAHDPKKSRGLGLFSIRERLEYLDGRMDIRSNSRKTTIDLAMPIARPVAS
jgi:two-component system, chemotaxis family, CheB/CheR fusion protein